MHPYLQPYLVAALNQPDVMLIIGYDAATVARTRELLVSHAATATRTSHPEQRYYAWTDEDQEVLLPEHPPNHVITTTGDHIVLTADDPKIAATVGTRIIRQLIMRGGEAAGGRCVHAGAVDIAVDGEGEGVLIGGRPGAGKTSVLTYLIERHGARPVANDRTVLVPTSDCSWRAVGVPLAWRFTPDGIAGSPALSKALADGEPTRGRDLVDGKVELAPSEVSRALGRRTLPAVRLTRIVVLLRSADPPPSTPEASFLRQHLDFGAEDFFAEDWLGIRPHLAGRCGHLSPATRSWWNEAVTAVPIQVVPWTDPAELPTVAAAVANGAQP